METNISKPLDTCFFGIVAKRAWGNHVSFIFTTSKSHKLVRAFGVNADDWWFNPGSEGFIRASYSENG
jgi:hypothetical protein